MCNRKSVSLETSRLILRTVTLEDIDAVALNMNLDEPPISRQEAENKVSWILANHQQNAAGKNIFEVLGRQEEDRCKRFA